MKIRMMVRGSLMMFLFITLMAGCDQPVQKKESMDLVISDGWEFKGADTLSWMQATVPGTVHTDLMANGVIEDPYYRTNEKSQQWIDKHDWVYKTQFDVPEKWLKSDELELNFEGLDTYANVSLNGTGILSADNFFRTWKVAVKELIKAEGNELEIYFDSPIKIGREKLAAFGYNLPASNDQSENGEVGEDKFSVFTRKPGYHYGWDWGPRFVTSGIWQPIKLTAWNRSKIRDVYFDQKAISAEAASLNVILQLDNTLESEAEVIVAFDGQTVAGANVALKKGKNEIQLPVQITNPKLWWTHDLGEPYLYEATVKVIAGNQIIDEHTQQIGLRSIEVIREADEAGRSFYFKLNGIPVFAKGANYIPQDMFLPRVSTEQYEGMIHSAKAANMNMLRIWGGGFYEKDLFYELCDQNGILVWQDFMFACSMYPGTPEFLENVKKEAEENVIRLRNHPSIALWCGNNEIDVAWDQWGWKKDYTEEQQQYLSDTYRKIFHEILAEATSKLHDEVYYWPSSPYNGEGDHATYKTKAGDVHYWGVWHGEHPFEDFENYVGRFMSEFGFQSFPEMETIEKFTIPEDWDIESEVMAAHQRSGIGNLRIKSYMDQYYRLPDNFEDMIYVGQVLQAEGMRYGLEAHRRAKPFNMGSLYWQIDDCWPVASWSGMDYYQKWKGLHYFVKKAFEPVILSPYASGDTVKIQVISDLQQPIEGQLDLKVLDFAGKVVWSKMMDVKIGADVSELLYQSTKQLLLAGFDEKEVLLQASLKSGEDLIAENIFYFTYVKNLNLPEAKPELYVGSVDGVVTVQLKSDQLIKNVFLDFEGSDGHFSDNYFDVLPNQNYEITYQTKDGRTPLASDLKLVSIKDTY